MAHCFCGNAARPDYGADEDADRDAMGHELRGSCLLEEACGASSFQAKARVADGTPAEASAGRLLQLGRELNTLEFQRKVRSIDCPCMARPWWAGAVWKEDIDDEWKQILTRYTPGMPVHEEDVDEIDRMHRAEQLPSGLKEYPFRFPDDNPRTSWTVLN